MAIGDWALKTWSNGVDVSNSTNWQRNEDKLNELDKAVKVLLKTGDEVVNNSSTAQDDNDFNVTLDADSYYEIDLNLSCDSNAAADMVILWAKGSGITVYKRFCAGIGYSGTASYYDGSNTHLTTAYNTAIVYAGIGWINEKLILKTGSSNNTLTLRWAQSSAQAYATTIYANSYMKITKMGTY